MILIAFLAMSYVLRGAIFRDLWGVKLVGDLLGVFLDVLVLSEVSMSRHFHFALYKNADSAGLSQFGFFCAVAVGIGGCKSKLED